MHTVFCFFTVVSSWCRILPFLLYLVHSVSFPVPFGVLLFLVLVCLWYISLFILQVNTKIIGTESRSHQKSQLTTEQGTGSDKIPHKCTLIHLNTFGNAKVRPQKTNYAFLHVVRLWKVLCSLLDIICHDTIAVTQRRRGICANVSLSEDIWYFSNIFTYVHFHLIYNFLHAILP